MLMIAGFGHDRNKERTVALGGFAMPDYPHSLVDFQRRFPDDAACAHYLADRRWPEGFYVRIVAMAGPGR